MIVLPEPRLAADVRSRLEGILGQDGISTSPMDRLACARDCWPLVLIWLQEKKVPYPPDAVCWPRDTAQVSAVLRLANETGIPVTPYGGGSGVCGGAIPLHGGITLDLKRMDRIVALDETSLLVHVEPGTNGQRFEDWLNARGYTLGHFPSSIYCSTVGGWVAARSAGQLSTRYGKIEDMVRGLEVVFPSGTVAEIRSAPRRAVGPDFLQMLVGSEGTLGVLTRLTLLVRPLPPGRIFRAFLTGDVETGIEVMRRVLREGVKPAAIRLYDRLDTLLVGKGAAKEAKRRGGFLGEIKHRLKDLLEASQAVFLRHPSVANWLAEFAPGKCLLIFTFEGRWEVIKAEEAVANEVALALGCEDKGPEPARRWWENRYDVSYKQSKVFEKGAFVDTMEVAAPWGKIPELYRAVRAALHPHAIVLAHFSHAYEDGSNIYFTFASAGKDAQDNERLYRMIWERALNAVLDTGGTMSHHHGIGFSKAAFMEREWGKPILDIYRAVKRHLDPKGILNPGKMGLGEMGEA